MELIGMVLFFIVGVVFGVYISLQVILFSDERILTIRWGKKQYFLIIREIK
jgi:hypothetical protein